MNNFRHYSKIVIFHHKHKRLQYGFAFFLFCMTLAWGLLPVSLFVLAPLGIETAILPLSLIDTLEKYMIIALIAFIFLLPTVMSIWTTYKIFRSAHDHHITFTEHGIEWFTSMSRGSYSWDKVKQLGSLYNRNYETEIWGILLNERIEGEESNCISLIEFANYKEIRSNINHPIRLAIRQYSYRVIPVDNKWDYYRHKVARGFSS